jgi:hypothetical protein
MSVTPPNVIAELHQIDQERRRLIQAERSIDQRQAAIEANTLLFIANWTAYAVGMAILAHRLLRSR